MMFPIILWSVARDYFDIIAFELASATKVLSVKDYMFEGKDYTAAIKEIYEPDSIADWKIDKKLTILSPYPKIIRLIQIDIPDPQYRIKSDGNPISTVSEQIKKIIRTKYGFLKDYEGKPDVIIHMGDTHEHSNFIASVFEKYGKEKVYKLDVPRFLSMIHDDQYALTKIDTPYMVDNFPIDYPVGKDLDILVAPHDFYSVMSKLIKFSRDYQGVFDIKDVSEPDGIRVRFHKMGEKSLEYQIDVTSSTMIFDDSCVETDDYKVLTEEWECYSRLASLKKKPNKTHHADYILARQHLVNEQILKNLGLLDVYKTLDLKGDDSE